MNSKNSDSKSLLPWVLGVGVAVLGLVGSVLFARQQDQAATQLEQARVDQAANALTQALEARVAAYAEIAFGLRGLFIVNPQLRRNEFIAAVAQLGVESRYPGIKNIAFTRYVAAKDKATFEARVRADTSVEPLGYPGFAIRPPGERAEYFVADYLWPQSGSKGIHGLDISAQPANLASMRYSKSSGKPVASGPFDLLQETSHRTGLVIRVPVFKGTEFLGSVAVTLRVFDVFQNLEREGFLRGLSLTLSDTGPTGDTAVSAAAVPATAPSLPLYATPAIPGDATRLHHHRDVSLYGRNWHLDAHPTQSLLTDTERLAPRWMELGGGLMALLLGGLVTALAQGRRHAMEREAASEERWKFAIEGSGDGLWDWSAPSTTVFFSPRWKSMLGYTDAEVGNQRTEWSERIHPDDQAQVHADVQAHLSGTSPVYTHAYRMRCKDGSWKWVLDRGMVVRRDAAGQALRVIGTHSDITATKNMEAALRAERDFSAAVVDHAGALVVVLDREGRIRRFNRESERVSGLTFSEVEGKFPWDTVLPPEIAQTHNPSWMGGSYVNEWVHRDGVRRLIEWNNSVLFGPTGVLDYVVAIGTDVTERNKNQAALEVSLREKSALLKEVHHRVKNNLQVITSLLRMEGRRSATPETRHVLTEMQGRIRSMALLHESLYRSGTLASVHLGPYLGELAKQVFQTQQLHPGVRLSLEMGHVAVGMDQALPLGLLVNELVANCLKHAFPDDRTGEVRVSLQAQGSDPRWCLQVADTGEGLPPNFEAQRAQSLGLQLVNDLTQQLGGALEITSQPGVGAVFSVLFRPIEPFALVMPAS
jgi:PAS domain S-box-containing protein